LSCSNEATIKTIDMNNTVTRKKDIRTTRKEMKAMGFQNIKFNTWGQSHERFSFFNPELYQEFLEGDDKTKCDWAKKFCIQITDGYKENEILSLEIDGIELLEWADRNWIDGSEQTFKLD
jgi:hypothetical protein